MIYPRSLPVLPLINSPHLYPLFTSPYSTFITFISQGTSVGMLPTCSLTCIFRSTPLHASPRPLHAPVHAHKRSEGHSFKNTTIQVPAEPLTRALYGWVERLG